MNTLIKFKKNILTKSFNSKVSTLVNNIIKNESNDLLIHNNGDVCRQDSEWVTFKHDFAPGIYLRQMTMKAEAVVIGAVFQNQEYKELYTLMKNQSFKMYLKTQKI